MNTTFLTSGTRKPDARFAVHATYLDNLPSPKARQAASYLTSHPRATQPSTAQPLSTRDNLFFSSCARFAGGATRGRNGLWEVTANVPLVQLDPAI